MTALKWLVIAAVLGYGGLLALMYVFQRALLYFPDTNHVLPAQAGLPQAQEVTLTSGDGEKLIAWFVAPRGDQPVVLYFQGNAEGLAARIARFTWLTADGTGLLALCYRGYGGSTGRPTEDGLIRDAGAAYDFARARYPARRIVLFGESLGTAVAVALAAGHEAAGVILDAPFTSAVEVGRRRLSIRAGALVYEGQISFGRAHRAGVGAAAGAAWRAGPHRAHSVCRAAVRAGARAQALCALPARRPCRSRRPRRGENGAGVSGRIALGTVRIEHAAKRAF